MQNNVVAFLLCHMTLCCIRSQEMADDSWSGVWWGRRGHGTLLLFWIFMAGESSLGCLCVTGRLKTKSHEREGH